MSAMQLKRIKKIQNVSVEECELFIDPENPHLCASPDGLIGLNGLLEIKCPYSAESAETIEEVCRKNDIGIKINSDGEYFIPKNHK